MTEREKFEQWARMPPRSWNVARYSEASAIKYGVAPGDYMVAAVRHMWQAWRARADASAHKAIYEDEV